MTTHSPDPGNTCFRLGPICHLQRTSLEGMAEVKQASPWWMNLWCWSDCSYRGRTDLMDFLYDTLSTVLKSMARSFSRFGCENSSENHFYGNITHFVHFFASWRREPENKDPRGVKGSFSTHVPLGTCERRGRKNNNQGKKGFSAATLPSFVPLLLCICTSKFLSWKTGLFIRLEMKLKWDEATCCFISWYRPLKREKTPWSRERENMHVFLCAFSPKLQSGQKQSYRLPWKMRQGAKDERRFERPLVTFAQLPTFWVSKRKERSFPRKDTCSKPNFTASVKQKGLEQGWQKATAKSLVSFHLLYIFFKLVK